MQISSFPNTNNINNNRKVPAKKGCPGAISFCGLDAFERSAVKFSKELCVETINQLLEGNKSPEIMKTMSKLRDSDPELIQLGRLADKYTETLSLEDKKILLKHEENMHWQELETPEIGLVRTFFDMTREGIKKDFIPAMKISTVNGLARLKQAYVAVGLSFASDEKHFNLLKNLIKNTPDNHPFSYLIKRQALKLACFVTVDSGSLVKLAEDVKKNTKNNDLKTLANTVINDHCKYDESELLSKLSKGDLVDFEKVSVIKTLANNKSKKLTKQLPSMLDKKEKNSFDKIKDATSWVVGQYKNKENFNTTKNAAIWAMGKCKSKENFELLCEIANKKDAKNLESREMALHSLVLYLRTNEVQVKNTLNKVIKEKSDLSELATILLEKAEGRYYVKDKELANLTAAEKYLYKKVRNKYVESDYKLNIQQENIMDRAFIPLKKTLSNLVSDQRKLHISADTYTKIFNTDAGTRLFTEDPQYGGCFCDSIVGVADSTMITVNKNLLKSAKKDSVLAHEFNHAFWYDSIMGGEDGVKLTSLYKKAVKQDRCLDSYAKLANYEYFAQGYEAYCSVYKPHNVMLENNNFSDPSNNVRSTLKRKDPDLYNFIEYCIKKYNG